MSRTAVEAVHMIRLLAIAMLTIAPVSHAQVTTTLGGSVTMSNDPQHPQIVVQCLRPDGVAFELRDVTGNPVLRLYCPTVPPEPQQHGINIPAPRDVLRDMCCHSLPRDSFVWPVPPSTLDGVNLP